MFLRALGTGFRIDRAHSMHHEYQSIGQQHQDGRIKIWLQCDIFLVRKAHPANVLSRNPDNTHCDRQKALFRVNPVLHIMDGGIAFTDSVNPIDERLLYLGITKTP